jgi:hypothetical protein
MVPALNNRFISLSKDISIESFPGAAGIHYTGRLWRTRGIHACWSVPGATSRTKTYLKSVARRVRWFGLPIAEKETLVDSCF